MINAPKDKLSDLKKTTKFGGRTFKKKQQSMFLEWKSNAILISFNKVIGYFWLRLAQLFGI